MAYPEVSQVLSQTGRPNDGTDATGFYNIEFHVDIYPEKEWESKLTKLELIDKMQRIYPFIRASTLTSRSLYRIMWRKRHPV